MVVTSVLSLFMTGMAITFVLHGKPCVWFRRHQEIKVRWRQILFTEVCLPLFYVRVCVCVCVRVCACAKISALNF